jgi:hypothetical protein
VDDTDQPILVFHQLDCVEQTSKLEFVIGNGNRCAKKAYRHFTEQDRDCTFVLETMQGAQKFPSGIR